MKVKDIYRCFNNINRIKIYEFCSKKSFNIKQIQNLINISYKSTINNIRILESLGLIKRAKIVTKSGYESKISSINLEKEDRGIYIKLKKEIWR